MLHLRVVVIECGLLPVLLCQVTSYAHGSSELLGIQIDAAINPGQWISTNQLSCLFQMELFSYIKLHQYHNACMYYVVFSFSAINVAVLARFQVIVVVLLSMTMESALGQPFRQSFNIGKQDLYGIGFLVLFCWCRLS